MEVRRRKPRREEEHVHRQKPRRQAPKLDTYLPNYQETLVHYHKSFGVLQELFDHRDFQGFEQDLRGSS
eukprot:symbB.v1.2.021022.t1/scaffold1798.1/size163522/1